jgi:hypothetical protein
VKIRGEFWSFACVSFRVWASTKSRGAEVWSAEFGVRNSELAWMNAGRRPKGARAEAARSLSAEYGSRESSTL